jgi:hypothetical protein
LFFLGRAHPGVMMALGHAFSIPVTPASTPSKSARSIRGQRCPVVGRITARHRRAGRPGRPGLALPGPPPGQSPDSQHTVSPKDHLNARLRWGVGPALRAQMPHSFGFDVFRVQKKTAEILGWTVRRPYHDGEAFYYYVAARGITGMPGQVSSGTLVTHCDTLPPLPPVITAVTSNFVRPADPADWAVQAGSQFLQVKIRQLASFSQSEGASGYYVYRWSSPQEYLNHLGNPLTGRVGYVSHINRASLRVFNDNGSGAPTLATHANKSVWYTVRAVANSACSSQVLSGHSAPMPGFLRDFKAPDAPTGDFVICRHMPITTFLNQEQVKPDRFGLPSDYTGIGVEAIRSSPMVVAADIEVALRRPDQSWLVVHHRRHTYQTGDTIHIDLPYRVPRFENIPLRIRVRGVTAHGVLSSYAVRTNDNLQQPEYVVHRFTITTEEQCRPISTATENPPVHEAFGPTGTANPISGSILFPEGQGVREWRVYRRVGSDGPLVLIAKAEGDAIPNPGTWQDDALPAANGSTVCYFGQILDQNANPSPLQPLGCVTLLNPDLPTPMLSAPSISEGSGGLMRVELEWFCDAAGVDRFEILAALEGGGTPEVSGLSSLISGGITETVSGDFPNLAFHTYQTPRVGGSMGGGPSFKIKLEVPAVPSVHFSVRACGPGNPTARTRGSASNVVTAQWQLQAAGPQAVIPWPARPLPGLFDHRQPIEQFTKGEGPFWPVIPPLEFQTPTGILVGLARHPFELVESRATAQLFSPEPPENYLFQLRENRDDASATGGLMPIMLYRYQVPSTAFPNARPNLVQCTPLIDRISWKIEGEKSGSLYYAVRDPFVIFVNLAEQIQLPLSGNWSDTATPVVGDAFNADPRPPYLEGATGAILLKDPLPVTTGAKYRHLIVQFDARGEIKRVIPIEPVQH